MPPATTVPHRTTSLLYPSSRYQAPTLATTLVLTAGTLLLNYLAWSVLLISGAVLSDAATEPHGGAQVLFLCVLSLALGVPLLRKGVLSHEWNPENQLVVTEEIVRDVVANAIGIGAVVAVIAMGVAVSFWWLVGDYDEELLGLPLPILVRLFLTCGTAVTYIEGLDQGLRYLLASPRNIRPLVCEVEYNGTAGPYLVALVQGLLRDNSVAGLLMQSSPETINGDCLTVRSADQVEFEQCQYWNRQLRVSRASQPKPSPTGLEEDLFQWAILRSLATTPPEVLKFLSAAPPRRQPHLALPLVRALCVHLLHLGDTIRSGLQLVPAGNMYAQEPHLPIGVWVAVRYTTQAVTQCLTLPSGSPTTQAPLTLLSPVALECLLRLRCDAHQVSRRIKAAEVVMQQCDAAALQIYNSSRYVALQPSTREWVQQLLMDQQQHQLVLLSPRMT